MENEYTPQGIDYLRRKLKKKRVRVERRYDFYEMKNKVKDLGISTPPELRWIEHNLGWCTKAVDTLNDRMVFDRFENDWLGFTEIYRANGLNVLIDACKTDALIASCSFAYIVPQLETGLIPEIQVIDAGNATGVMDEKTRLLKEGYAVLERNQRGTPTVEAYFLPGRVEYHRRDTEAVEVIEHAVPFPLLVPIVHRPDAKRPFGHSRISRACMSLLESAVRTVRRSEISAEFYSFPQKWATGLDPDAEQLNAWSASMSALLTATNDGDGNHPIFGQFMQQSQTPHSEQLKTLASAFAGETGLTLDDLGFVTSNPASSEAIKASHDALRLAAEKAQRDFAVGLLNTGFVAACLRDNFAYSREAIEDVSVVWRPIFRPDAAALSQIGDGAIKLNQAIPNYFDAASLRDLTGIEPAKTQDGRISTDDVNPEE